MTAAAVETLTVQQASLKYGLGVRYLTTLAMRERVEAVEVDGVWLVDGPSVASYVAAPRRRGRRTYRHVQAGPLLRQIELAGGVAAVGVEHRSAEEFAIARAKRSGRITEEMADYLAVRLLGLTLWEIAG